MAIDNKYGNVVLEHGDIGENEPVVVFRARDILLTEVLDAYHEMCKSEGSPKRHLDLIVETQKKVMEWQVDNFRETKVPDSEGSKAWRD